MRSAINLLALVLVLLAGGLPSQGQDATVVVTNAREVAAALPDNGLISEVLGEVDDDLDSIHINPSREPGPQAYVLALITKSAPNDITRSRYSGVSFTVSPVTDFQAFVTAIDYGKVTATNEARRTVKVKIDLERLAPDKLQDLLEDAGPTRPFGNAFEPGGDFGARMRETMGRQATPHLGRDEIDPGDRLGADFDEGDHVEIMLSDTPFYGVARRSKEGAFDTTLVEVELDDPGLLAKKIRKRSLRERLAKADEFVFWAPAERLRKLDGPPRAAHQERTWTDKTGKYRVVATYDGVEGDRVVLKKATGKQTKVPLTKLSEADQQYVKEAQQGANPFVAASRGAGGSMRADWSSVQTVRPRASRKWKWTPPQLPKPQPARVRVETLDLSPPPGESDFTEDFERFFVARDGLSAVALLEESGIDERVHLQRLDFEAGVSEPLVTCPPNSVVLDVLPDERLVLLRNDDHDSSRLYLQRLEPGELKPVSDFEAHPPGAFHKGIKGAHLLPGGRLVAHGTFGDWVLWDGGQAKALYRFDLDTGVNASVEIGPLGRFLFVAGNDAIFVIDTQSGRSVASIPTGDASIRRLSVDPGMQRLAIASGDSIATIDLKTGGIIDAFSGGLVRKGTVDFIGDLLLVDDRYLVAPKYPLVLWQYVMATKGNYDNHLTIRGGRMWYAARTGGGIGGAWSIASAKTPHAAIREKLAELGDLDDLVILTPGDKVTVAIDTDLGADQETRLYDTIVAAFKQAGYVLVDQADAGPDAKRAVVTCKRAPKPIEVLIANPDAKPPADQPGAIKIPRGFAIPRATPAWFGGRPGPTDWMYEKHKITPYLSSVTIRQDNEVLWSDGVQVHEGQSFSPTAKGGVQEVINQLTKPNLERLLNFQLPGQMCRSGPVGGAYGATLLDADGVVEDYFGEEE